MISKPLKKVFFLTTAYTLFLSIVVFIVAQKSPDLLYEYQWPLVAYFYVITLLSLMVVEFTAARNVENISNSFFGAMIGRMFISVIIALVIIYFDRESSTIFAVNFIILYFLYLGFEIYYLISNLQPRFNSEKTIENG